MRIGQYLPCQICGKEFYVEPNRLRRGPVKYCSNKCLGKANGDRTRGRPAPYVGEGCIERICVTCGRRYSTWPSQMKRRKIYCCSRQCADRRHASLVRKNISLIDVLFSAIFIAAGKYPFLYPAEYVDIRPEIYKRDNYTCQECGRDGRCCHHIDYNKFNCSPKNLVILCHSCHSRTNGNRKYWIDYLTARQTRFAEQ
jgi:hypothetical protein